MFRTLVSNLDMTPSPHFYIAEGDDVFAFHLAEIGLAATAASNHRNVEFFVGCGTSAQDAGPQNGQSGAKTDGRLQEGASAGRRTG